VKIACVGGGPAGLYFALLMKLHDSGNDITIFERNALESSYGWGVTFGNDLMTKLYRSDPFSAARIEKVASPWVSQIVDVQGKQVMRSMSSGHNIERQHLLDILAARTQDLGVRIEFGYEVTALSQLPNVDLIVGCDGGNSRIRYEAQFQTDVRLSRNKYIWLGSDKVFDSFTYAFVRTDSGWLWAYAYGISADLSTFIVECSPETWTGLGFNAMSAHDTIPLLEKIFERHLDGHRLIGQCRNTADIAWSNFRTVTNRCWHDGKVVLAGDAAHTTYFNIGWGTKLAIEDVIELAENLQRHDSVKTALKSYERRRQAALMQPQSDARFSAQWFENVPRYIDLEMRQFATLLDGRRSPLLPQLSPQLYYRLLRATEKVAVLRTLRTRAGPKVKAIYSKHKSV